MTSYEEFRPRCKMRYDFGDQIQVRYRHVDGGEYDTWVSGEEALQRLESDGATSRLEDLGYTERWNIQELRDRLNDDVRDALESELQNRLADGIEEALGGNLIGDNLADAVRGQGAQGEVERETQWSLLMKERAFREIVLKLAWIQLEGSFPDAGSDDEPNDWT